MAGIIKSESRCTPIESPKRKTTNNIHLDEGFSSHLRVAQRIIVESKIERA